MRFRVEIGGVRLVQDRPTDSRNRQQTRFCQDAETPLKDVSISGATSSDSWAWVELNYRPHAYQAASYEHELGSEVPTRLPFTNILLSTSRIYEHLRVFANSLRM
jgi:hypothetical protein